MNFAVDNLKNDAIMKMFKEIEQNEGRERPVEYDYSKLEGKIVEKFGTQGKFAKAMSLSERSISLKLSNKRPWKQSEMLKSADILEFPYSEMQDYFFTLKVQRA